MKRDGGLGEMMAPAASVDQVGGGAVCVCRGGIPENETAAKRKKVEKTCKSLKKKKGKKKVGAKSSEIQRISK